MRLSTLKSLGIMQRRLFLLALTIAASAFGAAKDVTFNKDVLPILQKRCQECHRPGEAAPMSFLTYKDTRPWAKAIRGAVVIKKMPPWFSDDVHGKFKNDRRLPQSEIDTLVAWVDGGAKEGNAADAPKGIEYAQGWSIGKPDVVIDMPVGFKVPASGTVDYVWFLAPTNFTEDKWVEKIEVRPGNSAVVHHVVLYARAPGSPYVKNAKLGEPYFPAKSNQLQQHKPDTGEGSFYTLGRDDLEMVSVYVPGGDAYQTLPGQARLIKAGSDLLFQMHYTANGKEAVDRSRVGIVFAKEPPKERVVNTFIFNGNMHIPPGEPNHPVLARVTVQEDVKLMSMFPHMHVRGKAMQYKAIYPSGESQILLNVPKYDFNWQLSYYLRDPITLPKGTKLEITAWYDNSPNNPANPDPKSDVYWGEQTWEEMLAAFVDFAIPVDMKTIDIVRPKKPQQASGAGAGQ